MLSHMTYPNPILPNSTKLIAVLEKPGSRMILHGRISTSFTRTVCVCSRVRFYGRWSSSFYKSKVFYCARTRQCVCRAYWVPASFLQCKDKPVCVYRVPARRHGECDIRCVNIWHRNRYSGFSLPMCIDLVFQGAIVAMCWGSDMCVGGRR